ncbi:MAG TPA: penicillin-binding protein 2 [Gammaproteobacteria bacterium]|nr:penicillin-binding protein 2 [Gammaproteobacteria bacterium]
MTTTKIPIYPGRRLVVLGLFLSGIALLAVRAVELQVFKHDFLQQKGNARQIRVVEIPAHRGMILDRLGEPLAISTPVDSIWANPTRVSHQPEDIQALAQLLGTSEKSLLSTLDAHPGRRFVYLKRHMTPEQAQQIAALNIHGIGVQREYRRYYPMGEIFGHVLGFTDIDDNGQEGIELAYNDWLTGKPGSKRVVKEGRGKVINVVDLIKAAHPGQDLRLSIDSRIQYLAYRELKAAVEANDAESGSVVVLDPRTGEVLAMVNQPFFNPNNRRQFQGRRYRNRAVKDLFEPGSTAKPFTISAALESGQFKPTTLIDTSPGRYKVSGYPIKDVRNYGVIDLATVISKSSNVGASKVALKIPKETLWDVFQKVGFGQPTGSGFPGEAAGVLRDYSLWYPLDQATLAFGYGFSVTPLQLAEAYSVIASDGMHRPVSFLQQTGDDIEGERVLKPETCQAVRKMMQKVVQPQGTGFRAVVEGYRVAGKTGTVRKAQRGGYSTDRYVSVFAGMVPAETPRLVAVVVINEPKAGKYYGGEVAAPVFSRIMSEALRQLNVPPDNLLPRNSVNTGTGPV